MQQRFMATPEQIEGPFYPSQFTRDSVGERVNDLTASGFSRPEGETLLVQGRVRAPDGLPIAGARVEIWQACASGAYPHPDDKSGFTSDPRLRPWGCSVTDAEGRYSFKTVIPGAYPDEGKLRPPHIHFRLEAPGFRMLITQMYFLGHPLNKEDALLNAVEESLRGLLMADPVELPGTEAGTRTCEFDFCLAGIDQRTGLILF